MPPLLQAAAVSSIVLSASRLPVICSVIYIPLLLACIYVPKEYRNTLILFFIHLSGVFAEAI